MRTRQRFLALLLLAWSCLFAPAWGQTPPRPPADYIINAGDELLVQVWGEERLTGPHKVLPDGSISFPLIGKIPAQGISTEQLASNITEGLRSQYKGQVPAVTVSVASPSGLQFTVMGRVKAPGIFTPGRYVNVLEAISMAGGPAEFANLNNILVLRKEGNGIRTIHLKAKRLFKGGSLGDVDLEGLSRVQTGDTIILR
jgi:polysaccharide biosynthesis/export protein